MDLTFLKAKIRSAWDKFKSSKNKASTVAAWAFSVVVSVVFAVMFVQAFADNEPKHYICDWVVIKSESPTCAKDGIAYYECKECGATKTMVIPKTDIHWLTDGDVEYRHDGDNLLERTTKYCRYCDYLEAGEWVKRGNFNECAAIECTYMWLFFSGKQGYILKTDLLTKATEENGDYKVVGAAYDTAGENHIVIACVELCDKLVRAENAGVAVLDAETVYGHIYYASIDGTVIVDEDKWDN